MPTPKRPNWDKWKLIPEAELWKVVALSVDIDPDFVTFAVESLYAETYPKPLVSPREFTDRLGVAVANRTKRPELMSTERFVYEAAKAKIRIAHFSHYARSVDWGLPPDFPIAIYKPKWKARDAWSEAELRDLLCGLEPNVGRSGFTEINEVAEDIRRAVLTGELLALESPLATQAEQIYGSSRFFRPSDTTRWATRVAGRFPKFPFRITDFPSPADDASQAPTDKVLEPRSEGAHLRVIGALLRLIVAKKPGQRTTFPSQNAVISAILQEYPNAPGLSKRELEGKFADANKVIA